MKRRHNDKRTKVSLRRKRSWIGLLFRRKTAPLIERKGHRRARAFAAANRRAYLWLALGAVIGAAWLLMVILVPPVLSPEDLADAVKAQMSRARPASLSTTAGVAAHPGQRQGVSGNNTEAENRSISLLHEDPKYLAIGFDRLSGFPFVVTDQMVDAMKNYSTASPQTIGQLPDEIRALNEKAVALKGFVMPMKLDHGLTTEFLLLKNQGLCCYGLAPKITEWVNVRMMGKGVKPIMHEPVTVCGTFHVGDVRENGQLLGIYQMDADQVKPPGK